MTINSPIKPIEKNCTPIITNNKPKKNKGFLNGVIQIPLNQLIVKNILIIKPDNNRKIPIIPKKCRGLVRYLLKKDKVIKSKNPWNILDELYLDFD